MVEYIQSLPDGWTIYVWIIAAGFILAAAAYFMWWGAKNEQFDEDIKYVVFDENDKANMSPEEYAKSVEVNKRQEARRAELQKELQNKNKD